MILADDGAATGSSMLAAIRAARLLQPSAIVVALPVASASAAAQLRAEADTLICIHTPESFAAVGDWYRDFHQTSDQEVARLLEDALLIQEAAAPRAR